MPIANLFLKCNVAISSKYIKDIQKKGANFIQMCQSVNVIQLQHANLIKVQYI